MSSPNKEEWKNPTDIMRVHRIKRQSSVNLSRSNSSPAVDLSRRNSLSSFSRKGGDLSDRALHSSKSEEAITSSNVAASQKRKNPFSCDSASHVSKRRSFLDEGTQFNNVSAVAAGVEQDSPSRNHLGKAPASDSPSPETDASSSGVESQPSNKLLHVLRLADKMDDDKKYAAKSSPSTVFQEISKRTAAKASTNILKETSNTKTLLPSSNNQSKIVADKQDILQAQPHPPTDWSLKQKMRVVVHSKIDSFHKHPGIDAKHVDSFSHHRLENAQGWNDLDLLQKIRRCCFHYSYPQIPWLTTFPRLSADFKSRSTSLIASTEEAVEAFERDWSNVFTSVYQQLRSGVCPYFYACAHQFTVLFRCQRSSSGASFSALLSPSTRGLREMLTKEDIEFRMPNIRTPKSSKVSRSKKGNQDVATNIENDSSLSQPDEQFRNNGSVNLESHQNCDKGISDSTCKSHDPRDENESKKEENDNDSDEGDNDDDIDDHYGASRWLEGMGLDKKDFPSLEPLKVKLQREGFREIDNRPQSMIYVEGADVHTFFNFLLNYQSCIASSGPQHGIPPTLLSPTPFIGSTLVQNIVKHSTIKEATGDGPMRDVKSHVFEVSGPIIPHHSLNVASILRSCPENLSSTVSYNTHFPTASLNTQAVNEVSKDRLTTGLSKLFVDFSLANPGLIGDVQDRIVSLPVLENGTAVREMNVSESGFSWKC